MKIEITDEMKSLKGKWFVSYCLFDHPDKEFRDNMKMLYYAVIYDLVKTEMYIRQLIENPDLELICFYPACDNKDKVKGKRRIGTIYDGYLYMG